MDAVALHLPDTVLGLSIAEDPLTPGGCVLIDREHGGEVLGRGGVPALELQRLDILALRHGSGHANVPFPTMGGKQLWADVFHGCGWRIQENVVLGLHRLLDPQDVRRAWGTFAECRVAYEEVRLEQQLVPRTGHLVILLHGLIRAKNSLQSLAQAFRTCGFDVANVNYPSTRRKIDEHAQQLGALLSRLQHVDTVSFVTHSMGGLVVRTLLAMTRHDPLWERLEVHRLLMLFPPSRGAIKAERWRNSVLARIVAGPSLDELPKDAAHRIPAPQCRFGIIAGRQDRTVRVREAYLPGAEAFCLMDVGHTLGMRDPQVVRAAVNYITVGRFNVPGELEPAKLGA